MDHRPKSRVVHCHFLPMACDRCGSTEGRCDLRLSLRSPFYLNLTRDFNKFSVVPCHVRKSFNQGTGNIVDVATPDGHQYRFDIKKKSGQPTRLCGSDYKTFICQFGMRTGYKILFNMQDMPEKIPIWPEGANGEQLSALYPQNMAPGGIDFHLTEEQWNRYNAILQWSGDVDCVYLHCFSTSDIELNYMRIPKIISEALNLGDSGDAFLSLHGGMIIQAEYARCADGGTRFTSGWDFFVTTSNFAAGLLVLVILKRNRIQLVSMVFHVL